MSTVDPSVSGMQFPVIPLDEEVVAWSRMLCVDAVENAHSGHPGAALAATPAMHLLFGRHLRYDPTDPKWDARDRFILSAGHASVMLYVQLLLSGYSLSMEDIREFRRLGSKTPGHPELGHTPGVEVTTGPLGQGLATAVGMAMALKRRVARESHIPEEAQPHVWVFCGDGDLQEGLSYESGALAGNMRLDNLTVLFDDNHIQIDGGTSITTCEEVAVRFEAQGWRTIRVDLAESGDIDLVALDAALVESRTHSGKPTLVLMRSQIAWPAPNAVNTAKSHGAPLGPEEVARVREILSLETGPFEWSVAAENERRNRLCRSETIRGIVDALVKQTDDKLPSDLLRYSGSVTAPFFNPGENIATRDASGVMIQFLAEKDPLLWGGSADLSEPNRTEILGGGVFGSPLVSDLGYAGRNIRWGVREGAMAAAMNGIALVDECPIFGGTFLVFSDYQRPALRLAALMGLPVVHVWSHDSLAVGQDGPTHQPIEQLSSLRLIPGFSVVRPADANETVVAWAQALIRRGPVGLALGRQPVPVLDVEIDRVREGVPRGAYCLNDTDDPEIVVIASGSEVALALAAAEIRNDIEIRVVSVPCLEWFNEQSQEYRDSVIPPKNSKRLIIEAGATQGWYEVAGEHGAVLGVDEFGASGPAGEVLEAYGMTVDRVVAAIESL